MKESMAKMGRPSVYSDELAKEIVERISSGESVRAIGRDKGMPEAKTIYNWLLDEDKKEFLQQYSTAIDVRTELLADEIIELADESVDDIKGDKSDAARVQARKLQVDSRKWAASKMKPKKYGDKVDLTSNGKELPAPIFSLDVHTNNGHKENS